MVDETQEPEIITMSRKEVLSLREAALHEVDTYERILNLSPRTSELRREHRHRSFQSRCSTVVSGNPAQHRR